MADDALIFQNIHTALDHKGAVHVTRIRHLASGFDALAYRCSLEEDFDGAAQCYGDPNPHPVDPVHNPATARQADIKRRDRTGRTKPDDRTALDFLGNATSPHTNFDHGSTDFAWVGVHSAPPTKAAAGVLPARGRFSIDMRSHLGARRRPINPGEKEIPGYGKTIPLGPHEESWFPAVQPSDAPAPGFYVSTSAVVADASRSAWEQERYVDAQSIPYAALTPWFKTWGTELGDFGLAMDPLTGAASGFVFADAGYQNKVGEVSTKLLSLLGGDEEGRYLFLAFPRSGRGISPVWKYGFNFASQMGARTSILKLNDAPDPASLIIFLTLGADFDKFDRFRSRRMSDRETVQADWLYQRSGGVIERVLARYGYAPPGG